MRSVERLTELSFFSSVSSRPFTRTEERLSDPPLLPGAPAGNRREMLGTITILQVALQLLTHRN
jgi:hypothetical protein